MRGKLILYYFHQYFIRITPAGAGKTDLFSGSAGFTRDHPRRCGENLIRSVANALRKGSPPQVRGKLNPYIFFQTYCRITPAGAGKTACLWIHSATSIGSPPQVRGKHSFVAYKCLKCRITPAGAGKTEHNSKQRNDKLDHPRRCGENANHKM